jgi:hypothetical protein
MSEIIIEGPKYKILEDEPVVSTYSIKVNPTCDEEFMIEDSVGRSIPFIMACLDDLIEDLNKFYVAYQSQIRDDIMRYQEYKV